MTKPRSARPFSSSAVTRWVRPESPAAYAVLTVVVSALTLGLPATADTVWQTCVNDVLLAGFGPVFALTAPLVIGVAVISLLAARGWVSSWGILPVLLVIVGGAELGRYLGGSAHVEPYPLLSTTGSWTMSSLLAGSVNQVTGYLQAYGPGKFLSALLAGSYLGWFWNRAWSEAGRLGKQLSATAANILNNRSDSDDPPASRRAA